MWIARGLIYVFIGASLFWIAQPADRPFVFIIGGLLMGAGLCGVLYAITVLRTDRNYFWELLRSVFDLGFGLSILIYAPGDLNRLLDVLAFWATTYAFIHAVQAIYISMLSGGKQPRNISGSLLHLASVILAGILAYVLLMVPNGTTVSLFLTGGLVLLLGLIILVLAINQRQTLLADEPF